VAKTDSVAIEYSRQDNNHEQLETEPNSSASSNADKLSEAQDSIVALTQQLRDKDSRILELESVQKTLTKDKNFLTSRDLERESVVTGLESQKMALETRVNYMQKQLQDFEGKRAKLKEISSTSKEEVQQAKEELSKCKQRLALTESDLCATKKVLEACQTELNLVRGEADNSLRNLNSEQFRLDSALMLTETLLAEERLKCKDLLQQLGTANEQLAQLQKMLSLKESEIVRQSRAMSIDSVRSPSILSTEDAGESVRRRPSTTTEQSIKALKAECERLAIENTRIKASSQIEYIRNIMLRFLQLPDQRKTLLPVLGNLFRFTDAELASIKK
jgi:chromosome segregation ATPase